MNKLVFSLIVVIIFLPFFSAEDLRITLIPRFWVGENESLPGQNFTQISFEVVGRNFHTRYRILNLSIREAFPKELEDSFSNETNTLAVLQEKVLFTSERIDVSKSDGKNLSFLIGVHGVEEDGSYVFDGEYIRIMIDTPTKEKKERPFLVEFGEKLWEGNPLAGIISFLSIISLFCFFYWKEDGWGLNSDLRNWRKKLFAKDIKNLEKLKKKYIDKDVEKIKKWKKEQRIKKEERMEEEEGWK